MSNTAKFTSLAKSFIAAATDAATIADSGSNKRANASALGRALWAEYDEASSPMVVFNALIEAGFLPQESIAQFKGGVFNADYESTFNGSTEYYGKGVAVPESFGGKSKEALTRMAMAKKAKVINEKNVRHPVYVALQNSKPKTATKLSRKPRMPGSGITETKALSSPVAPVLTIATGNDWHGIAKSFMDTKPTMAQRRAILMDLQSVFGCDIEEAV